MSTNHTGKAAAIIAAGGKSSRMDGGDKLFAEIAGIPVLIRAVSAFEKAESISEIIIASKPESTEKIRLLCREHGISKLKAVIKGGEQRQESVLNAVKEVSGGIDVIAVHDGARPFITPESIDGLVELAREKGAVIPAVRVKETVKTVKDGRIIATPDRSGLYLAQTPQTFLLTQYLEAVGAGIARPQNSSVTDDAMLMEAAGFDVYITEGDYRNIKITTPDDLDNAQLRIGSGYDVHRFAENRELVLCGVSIPYEAGLMGHSDADVAVHALMDALLGALALGDIGVHFPDSEQEYKGVSSMELLRRVVKLINERGYEPVNLDITIIAERPRMSPHIGKMRENIATVCKIPCDAVSVKATTEEGLGLAGEGIGANAACLLKRKIIT
jgi:2-C-methyl-D-erythritol 2,4-cyclodiphosphate synthase/2-C-methyl-D-erythritol 4-phosphate cytidylyltransferase